MWIHHDLKIIICFRSIVKILIYSFKILFLRLSSRRVFAVIDNLKKNNSKKQNMINGFPC